MLACELAVSVVLLILVTGGVVAVILRLIDSCAVRFRELVVTCWDLVLACELAASVVLLILVVGLLRRVCCKTAVILSC